jgi:geranylgeranyl diphosphate synthase type II
MKKMKSESELERWRQNKCQLITNKLSENLISLAQNQPIDIATLLSAMRHSLLSGGKRIRPLLTFAAADALGEKETSALPGAMAVEMIHAYSLIHDDLPALDNDDLRRGQPSCHKVFGEATAILAGDALQSLAFETLASLAIKPKWASRASQAILILAKAIGPLGMVGGQAEDLAFEKRAPTLEESRAMERRKTGELIAASLGVGAALAGADQKTLKIFRRIGILVGEAYQIVDDLLNQVGDPKLLGKAVGSDAKRGKITTPTLLGQDQANSEAERLMREALDLTAAFSSNKLNWLLKALINRVR